MICTKSLRSRRQSYFYNRALKCWMDIKDLCSIGNNYVTAVMSTSTMEKGQRRWQISVGMNKQQQHTHNTTKQIDEDEDDIISPNVENYDTKDTAVRTEKVRRMISCRYSFIGGLFSLLEIFLTIIILCGTALLLCVMMNSPRRLFFFVMGYCDP